MHYYPTLAIRHYAFSLLSETALRVYQLSISLILTAHLWPQTKQWLAITLQQYRMMIMWTAGMGWQNYYRDGDKIKEWGGNDINIFYSK